MSLTELELYRNGIGFLKQRALHPQKCSSRGWVTSVKDKGSPCWVKDSLRVTSLGMGYSFVSLGERSWKPRKACLVRSDLTSPHLPLFSRPNPWGPGIAPNNRSQLETNARSFAQASRVCVCLHVSVSNALCPHHLPVWGDCTLRLRSKAQLYLGALSGISS